MTDMSGVWHCLAYFSPGIVLTLEFAQWPFVWLAQWQIHLAIWWNPQKRHSFAPTSKLIFFWPIVCCFFFLVLDTMVFTSLAICHLLVFVWWLLNSSWSAAHSPAGWLCCTCKRKVQYLCFCLIYTCNGFLCMAKTETSQLENIWLIFSRHDTEAVCSREQWLVTHLKNFYIRLICKKFKETCRSWWQFRAVELDSKQFWLIGAGAKHFKMAEPEPKICFRFHSPGLWGKLTFCRVNMSCHMFA